MYCYTYLGEFAKARQTAAAAASAYVEPSAGDRGALSRHHEPGRPGRGSAHARPPALANGAIAAARRLGLDRQYLAFSAFRTAALLALERRDLATAADLTEHVLGMLGGGRPFFDYLAQLDRARIWAAGGNLDEALASLPAARTALRSEHSVVLAQADELEARFRLALGDHSGARGAAQRLPDDRRVVMSAVIALGAQDPQERRRGPQQRPGPGTDDPYRPGAATAARQYRHRAKLAPGTPTGQRGSGHRRAPRLRPYGAGDGPSACRPPCFGLSPLPQHRQPEGIDRCWPASPEVDALPSRHRPGCLTRSPTPRYVCSRSCLSA